MKKMKRLFKRSTAVLAAIAVMASVFSVVAFAEEATTEAPVVQEPQAANPAEAQLLSDLGMISVQEGHDVTRAEFSTYVANFLNLGTASYGGTLPFQDVTAETPAYQQIGILYDLGILSKADTFRPDDVILESEATKMMIMALGYEEEAKERGGYPGGYMSYSSTLGLNRALDGDTKLTYAECVNMFYRALSVEIRLIQLGSGIITGRSTILESYHNITKIDGQITGTQRSGLDSISAKTKEGHLRLGTQEYKLREKGYRSALKESLGYNVRAYVYKADNEIVGYEMMSDEAIVLQANDVIDVSNSIVETEKRKYTLANGYKVIFNGVAYECTEEELKFEDGTLTLINSSGNGYDVVVAWKTEYMIVGSFATSGEVVTDANGHGYGKEEATKVLNLADANKEYEFSMVQDGVEESCSMKALRDFPTLAIWMSPDGSFIKVKGFNVQKAGVLTAVHDEYLVIGEEKVALSGYAKKETWSADVATETTFQFTEDGEIIGKATAGASGTASSMKYGILLKKAEGSFNTYKLYLLTAEGEKQSYEMNDKVVLDGNPLSSTDVYKNPALYNYQLIKYQLDSDNKIKKLDLAEDVTEDPYPDYRTPEDEDNSLRLFYTKPTDIARTEDAYKLFEWWGGTGGSHTTFGPFVAPKKAAVFFAPEEVKGVKDAVSAATAKIDVEDFGAGNLSQLAYGDRKNAYIYDVKEDADCGAIIVFTTNPEKTMPAFGWDASTAIVNEVMTGLNKDGQEVRKIVLNVAGKNQEYFFSEMLNDEFDQVVSGKKPGEVMIETKKVSVDKKFYEIEPGDIVRLIKEGNIISNLQVAYKYDKDTGKGEVGPGISDFARFDGLDTYGYTTQHFYYIGHVYNVTQDRILIRDEYDNRVYPMPPYTNTVVMKFDKAMNAIRPISRADILTELNSSADAANRVFACTYSGERLDMLVFYDAD